MGLHQAASGLNVRIGSVMLKGQPEASNSSVITGKKQSFAVCMLVFSLVMQVILQIFQACLQRIFQISQAHSQVSTDAMSKTYISKLMVAMMKS